MAGKRTVKPLGMNGAPGKTSDGLTGPPHTAASVPADLDRAPDWTASARRSVRGWRRAYDGPKRQDRFGAYGVDLEVRLSLAQIAGVARQCGIHPDVLGPCRRAAAQLDWILMVRPIKLAAMEYAGEYAKLPKPEAIKVKADPNTGLIRYVDPTPQRRQQRFEQDKRSGAIDSGYAKEQGLRLDDEGYLVNAKRQKYYSDMDLYEVLRGSDGGAVRLGSGVSATEGRADRRKLDLLINILHDRGCDFALIQHGPDRQWVKHQPRNERITAFTPDGEVYLLEGDAPVAEFIESLVGTGYRRGEMIDLADDVPGITIASQC